MDENTDDFSKHAINWSRLLMCQAFADENTAIYYMSTTDFSCMVVDKWPISTSYIEVRTVFSLYVAQEKRSMK